LEDKDTEDWSLLDVMPYSLVDHSGVPKEYIALIFAMKIEVAVSYETLAMLYSATTEKTEATP
jgi:predicted nucleic acid-binding protein